MVDQQCEDCTGYAWCAECGMPTECMMRAGKSISRAEALRLSQETLERAERERVNAGRPDVEALRDAVIEEARCLCVVVSAHSARGVGKDGLPSREQQIIDLGPLCRAVARLREVERK